MIYRPQFPYPFVKDCEPQRCHYSFDATNTPALTQTLDPLTQTSAIPLRTDRDADFLLRAWQMNGTRSRGRTIVLFRLIDPYNNPLSDEGNANQTQNFEDPFLGAVADGASPVVMESQNWGIYCPAGSNFNLLLYNQTANPADLSGIALILHGVKMYSSKRCA